MIKEENPDLEVPFEPDEMCDCEFCVAERNMELAEGGSGDAFNQLLYQIRALRQGGLDPRLLQNPPTQSRH